MTASAALPADDFDAVILTVCLLAILMALAFLGLGAWDNLRRPGVPDDARDPEVWADETLVLTRANQATHATAGGFTNPAYYSRMSAVGSVPPAVHEPRRHRRPPWYAAVLAGVWLPVASEFDRLAGRSVVRPTRSASVNELATNLTDDAVSGMRVVDPDEGPVRMPIEALINSAHVGAHNSGESRQPGSDRLPKHFAPESEEDVARIWGWLNRQDEYRPRHPGDTEVWVMPALDEGAEVSA